jgi:uncharacterized protein YdaU (DUF1376 family)
MSRADTWMPLYIGDYLADTMHLNATEHGAYLLLLMHHWRNGPLPNDDKALAAIARTTPQVWAKVGKVVRSFFQITVDDQLVQKRLVEERNRVDGIGSKRAEAGRKGAENRWKDDDQGGGGGGGSGGNPKPNGMANATILPMAKGKQTERQRPPQLQSQLEKEELSGRDLPLTPRAPTLLPLDWYPSPEGLALATSLGLDVPRTVRMFRNHFANGTALPDWSARFLKWCDDEINFTKGKGGAKSDSRLDWIIDDMLDGGTLQ